MTINDSAVLLKGSIMRKKEFLEHWRSLESGQPVAQSPIMYKHEGSTYGEDSIRLTGSPRFVDAVLSRLKDLLDGEASETRLGVSYGPCTGREGKTPPPMGSIACYVQCHQRGDDAVIMNRKIELMGQGRLREAYTAQFA